jgi:hypothetical protein
MYKVLPKHNRALHPRAMIRLAPSDLLLVHHVISGSSIDVGCHGHF